MGVLSFFKNLMSSESEGNTNSTVKTERKEVPKDEFKKNNQSLKDLDELLSDLDHLIVKLEKYPQALNKSLPIDLMDSVLKGAISSMINTLQLGYYAQGAMDKNEYEQLEPLLDFWGGIIKERKVDEELFNDFKVSLVEFTKNNPDWADDGWTVEKFFEEKIWIGFQDIYKKAKHQFQKLQKILEKQSGKVEALLQSDFSIIDPYEFEQLIAELFNKMGYETEVTSGSGDYGIDVIAKNGHEKIAIQAKKYSKGNNVGNRSVQRILGAMQLRTVKADKAILVTTSDFTTPAREQAKETPLELWDGIHLSVLLKKYM